MHGVRLDLIKCVQQFLHGKGFCRVSSYMVYETTFFSVTFITFFTGERVLSSVSSHMFLES